MVPVLAPKLLSSAVVKIADAMVASPVDVIVDRRESHAEGQKLGININLVSCEIDVSFGNTVELSRVESHLIVLTCLRHVV